MARGFIIGGGSGGVDCDAATANSVDIRSGKTAGIAGYDDIIAGTMPESWGGTIIPTSYEQRFNGGRYLLSDIAVPGFSMPSADVIRAGAAVSIYNQTVVGTWSGYTPATEYFWNAGNTGGVVGAGSLCFGSLGQVYSNDDSLSANMLTTPGLIDLRRFSHIFVDIAKSGAFSSGGVSIYRVAAGGDSRLLCTFSATSDNYTRMSYQYDASWAGYLRLVFTKQGTGILRWGIQNV